MSERVEIEYALTVNVEDATTQIRQLERLLFRTMSLLRRMGLPENVTAVINQIQRLITVLRMLRVSLLMLQAATGPWGWIMGGMGLAVAGLTMGDMLYDNTRGY